MTYNKEHQREKMLSHESEHQKKIGSEKVLDFLKILTQKESDAEAYDLLQDPVKIVEIFRDLESLKNFTTIIDNINARATETPVKKEIQRSDEPMVVFGHGAAEDRTFPDPEQNEEIWYESFEKLKKFLNDKEEINTRDVEQVALTLFNLINHTHVYLNGNGRVARILYYVISPNIDKKGEEFDNEFKKITSKENSIGEAYRVHEKFQQVVYQKMLLSRGVNPSLDAEGYFYSQANGMQNSFEQNKIKFLAIYDVLKDNQKYNLSDFMEKLNDKPVKHSDVEYVLPFSKEDFSSSEEYNHELDTWFLSKEKWDAIEQKDELRKLRQKVKKRVRTIRKKFVENVIDISLTGDLLETKFGKDVEGEMQMAFDLELIRD